MVVKSDDTKVLYFGRWKTVRDGANEYRISDTQYNACEFSFRGSWVRWLGPVGPDQGFSEIYLDGDFQEVLDGYRSEAEANVLRFEKVGLPEIRMHTLRLVVKKQRHPDATDCCLTVGSFEAEEPIHYPTEIKLRMRAEYDKIKNGSKEYIPPEEWTRISKKAWAPERGAALDSGLFRDMFDRLIRNLNDCFAMPSYCSADFKSFYPYGGPGWSQWLPASNDGRMLAGAAGCLRWEEREDLRRIVDTIVSDISSRMRADGYCSYYPESESYDLQWKHVQEPEGFEIVLKPDGAYRYYKDTDTYVFDNFINIERKNYDRVFWTRGLLAAGLAGDDRAYGILRRMYDWFNASPYLKDILDGPNATNGLPGGPLMYLSPAGIPEDLVVTERYYDQDYWIEELSNREPLCISYYPGINPHCYELLGLEAFIDEYVSTGAQKYLDAALGGWEIFKGSFLHTGGILAICEGSEVTYYPKSFFITTGHTGETCGSVFWINLNSKLLQLYPEHEKYAREIEEALYNAIGGVQTSQGNIRYHSKLHWKKEEIPAPGNTCCEVSSAGLIGRLPEFVYSLDHQGLYVNLFAASSVEWEQKGAKMKLQMETRFPYDAGVMIRITVSREMYANIRIRIPSWCTGDMEIMVNGAVEATGRSGSYFSLVRTWKNGDTISFMLPIDFEMIKYSGMDQVEGNQDRYALMYGPVLMALQCSLEDAGQIPRIAVPAESLPERLNPVEGRPLEYAIEGHPGYRYVPFWKIDDETFTCYPVFPSGGKAYIP